MSVDANAVEDDVTATAEAPAAGSAPTLVSRPARTRRIAAWVEQHIEANPSAGSPEAYLDGVRAVAVTSVVVLHAWGWAGSPSLVVFGHSIDFLVGRFGWGVDLFFLLSGFLLARPWFVAECSGGPQPRLGRYLHRRVSRLVPGYYVSLAVLLAIYVPLTVVPTESVTGSIGLWNLGAHLTFLQHALPVSLGDFNGVNGAYWTLTMEFLFYLSLPFAVRLFTGRRALVMPLVFLATTVLWIYLSLHSLNGLVRLLVGAVHGHTSPLVGVPATEVYMRQNLLVNGFPTWWFVFSLGIALARLVVRHRAGVLSSRLLSPRAGLAAAVIGVVSLVVLCYEITRGTTLHPTSEFWWYAGRTADAVALAMILFGLTFGPAWLRRPLEWLPVRFVGWVSYGVYLYHLIVMYVVFSLTFVAHQNHRTAFFSGLALTCVITLVVATVSWVMIERPFLVSARASGHARSPRRRWLPVLVGTLALLIVGFAVGSNTHLPQPVVSGPLGKVRGPTLIQPLTGVATPASARRLGVLYPDERKFLEACGARRGATEGLSTLKWGMTGSVFACRNGRAARTALRSIPPWESVLGFQRLESAVAGVLLYHRAAPQDTPNTPYQFHVRYRSGAHLIGVVIVAKTEAAGRAAARLVLAAAMKRYPVSP